MGVIIQTTKVSWKHFIFGTLFIEFGITMIIGFPLEVGSSLEFIKEKINTDNVELVGNFLYDFLNLLFMLLFISIYKPFRKIIISVCNVKPLYLFRTYVYIFLCNVINIVVDKITNLYFFNSANIQAEYLGIETLNEQSLIIFIFTILSLVIIGPIYEEVLFRGIIIKFFEVRYSFAIGLIISSLLFGSVHNYDIGFIIFATMMGVMYSLLYKKTNSLFPCMIAHITYNLYAFL